MTDSGRTVLAKDAAPLSERRIVISKQTNRFSYSSEDFLQKRCKILIF